MVLAPATWKMNLRVCQRLTQPRTQKTSNLEITNRHHPRRKHHNYERDASQDSIFNGVTSWAIGAAFQGEAEFDLRVITSINDDRRRRLNWNSPVNFLWRLSVTNFTELRWIIIDVSDTDNSTHIVNSLCILQEELIKLQWMEKWINFLQIIKYNPYYLIIREAGIARSV
jgi:hypothetical protein